MNCDCFKKDSIRKYAFSNDSAPIYKDLGLCIDCNKNYILKGNGWKLISKAEFRRIVGERRSKYENGKDK